MNEKNFRKNRLSLNKKLLQRTSSIHLNYSRNLSEEQKNELQELAREIIYEQCSRAVIDREQLKKLHKQTSEFLSTSLSLFMPFMEKEPSFLSQFQRVDNTEMQPLELKGEGRKIGKYNKKILPSAHKTHKNIPFAENKEVLNRLKKEYHQILSHGRQSKTFEKLRFSDDQLQNSHFSRALRLYKKHTTNQNCFQECENFNKSVSKAKKACEESFYYDSDGKVFLTKPFESQIIPQKMKEIQINTKVLEKNLISNPVVQVVKFNSCYSSQQNSFEVMKKMKNLDSLPSLSLLRPIKPIEQGIKIKLVSHPIRTFKKNSLK